MGWATEATGFPPDGHNLCNTKSVIFSSGMRRIADMVRSTTGNYVTSLIIGANGNEDRRNGFLMPVFDQIEFVCDKIKNDPEPMGTIYK